MTIKDVYKMFPDETVFRVYDREMHLVTEPDDHAEVDRLRWERKAYAGRFELLPLGMIYLV